jgi:hypothetical protein
MDPSLANEPVSSDCTAFRDLVRRAFASGEFAILLFRYANCGGAKDYFIARSEIELDTVMRRARPKTSVTVFFETNFKLKGNACVQLCELAVEFLPTVHSRYEGVDLIRIDGPTCELDAERFTYATEPTEIRQWFVENDGAPVVAGTMEFWHDNCREIVTVYVPDEDGVVRPGAY